MRPRIFWLHFQLGRPPKNRCHGYKIKLHLMVRLQFWSFGKCGINHSLPLLPGPLWSRVVVSVSPIYGSTRLVWKLLVLARNTWYHVTVHKLFVLKIIEVIIVYKGLLLLVSSNHIIVCELLVLDRNSWDPITMQIISIR